MRNIILASGSPRRKELLAQAGYDFVIEVSDADENIDRKEPGALVEELSRRKAGAVADLHRGQKDSAAKGDADTVVPACDGEKSDGAGGVLTIIGADTVVALDGQILGKPDGEEDAMRMLRALSGHTHQVYTGVSLFLLRDGQTVAQDTFHVRTDVHMREISEEEIHRYVATGEPLDKAGAYGIQGKAAVFISGICGDYYNVVGLPVCELVSRMRRLWKENGIHE